jgi:hypothetical protein
MPRREAEPLSGLAKHGTCPYRADLQQCAHALKCPKSERTKWKVVGA